MLKCDLRESLRRLHIGLRPLVVGIGDALHTVLVHKEIVYLCHIALYSNCYVHTVGESSPQRLVLPPTREAHCVDVNGRVGTE